MLHTSLKQVNPRSCILEYFLKNTDQHYTADNIYQHFIDLGEEIGLPTIYRVLTQLEQAGLLLRHNFAKNKFTFELNQGNHHDHIVCLECGHIEEFHDEQIEKRQKEIAEKRGFSIREHALYIYVDCLKEKCPNK
jgi:Fur family transcriptional regulator, ferric uptake regulator